MIYFTSDWHIGHHNIIGYDGRPFRDVNHMREVLINNYNSTVSEGEVCYFLGDMGWFKDDEIKSTIERLNGTKIFITGNHDKGRESVMKCGFAAVMNGMKMQIAGEQVTMSHCPLLGFWREDTKDMKGASDGENWHGEFRHGKYSFPSFGQWHLHGHTHKKPEEKILGKQWDVGVVANNYRPIAIKTIEKWISRG